MLTLNPAIPLSLYIHFPWCVQKCPYCDFNSHQLKNELPEVNYIDQLLRDLDQDLPLVYGRRLTSIFMGGGTPSLFSPKQIERLLREIQARFNYPPHLEITLEANPGTVEQERFHGFYQAGINRLSLGIQSFNDNQLKILGRIHNVKQAKTAINAAKTAGFSNINLDLMFGLPKQSSEQGIMDLQNAIEFSPPHISWYQLTIEPNTLFHAKPPVLPDDDSIWELQKSGQRLLADRGYAQYEVSAYTKNQAYCKHNLNYWQFGDYLGIGAGAHAKISDVDAGTIKRYWKIKHPKSYSEASDFIAGEKILTENEIAFEFMLNALRLSQPIPLTLFYERSGLDFSSIENNLERAKQQNFLDYNNREIKLTEHGKLFLNDVLEIFL